MTKNDIDNAFNILEFHKNTINRISQEMSYILKELKAVIPTSDPSLSSYLTNKITDLTKGLHQKSGDDF